MICNGCGQLQGVKAYDAELWSIYHRLDNSKRFIEPFVYTQDDLEELGFYDDEEMYDSVMLSMERNMAERGLCPECGRPDLRGVTPDQIMSEEDAKDLADMYAEMAAE